MTLSEPFFDHAERVRDVPSRIQQVQERLRSLLSDSEQVDRATPAGACLGPLLAALEWAGEHRHVQEALPHFDQVETVNDLRSVVARLNLETLPIERPMRSLREDMLPCLYEAKNGNLYVVIAREAQNSFLVFDGTKDAFYQMVPSAEDSGTAYLVRPTDFEADRRDVERYGWVQALVGRFKRTFFNLFMLTFVINMLALVVPLYVMSVYDKAVGAKSVMTLGYLLAGVAIALCADVFLRNVRARYMAYLGSRIECLVTTTAFEKLLHLPLGLTESAPIGSQVTRLKQFESIREVFSGSLATTVLDLPFFMVFVVAIFYIGGVLGWVPVALMVAYVVMAFATVPLTRMRVRQAGDTKSENRNFLMELAAKRDTIRDAGAEDVWLNRFRDIAGRTIVTQFAAQKLSMTIQTIAQAMVVIAGAVTVGIGTVLAMAGDLSAGALIAVMTLVWRVLSPLQSAFLSLNRIGQTRESLVQINGLMKLATERRPGELPTFCRKFKGHLAMRRVGFRYSAKSEPALRGIDLEINPGEFVAITGPGGSGKSTALKAFARLYQPQAGVVTLDKLDLRQLDVAEIRHAIGYVPQRPVFFYGTIYQNMKLANPAATREDMFEALEMVGALEIVKGLSEGLDTRLTSTPSYEFSSGLLQQIMVAQALVKKSSVYLMDEPGNNLDRVGDEALMNMFKKIKGTATLVMVTHRPSHMKLADRVVVVEQGVIVAEGPPDDVLPAIAQMQQARALANS